MPERDSTYHFTKRSSQDATPRPTGVKPVDIFVAEQLKSHPDVVYAGSHQPTNGPLEIAMPGERLWKHMEYRDFVTNHIVAPKLPLSDPEQLKAYMDKLIDDGQFADLLVHPDGIDYPRSRDLPRNKSLSVGRLFFKEQVGKVITQTTQELNDVGKKLGLPTRPATEEGRTLDHLTVVSVYPNSEVASLLMRSVRYLEEKGYEDSGEHRIVSQETLGLHNFVPSGRAFEKTKQNLAPFLNKVQ